MNYAQKKLTLLELRQADLNNAQKKLTLLKEAFTMHAALLDVRAMLWLLIKMPVLYSIQQAPMLGVKTKTIRSLLLLINQPIQHTPMLVIKTKTTSSVVTK